MSPIGHLLTCYPEKFGVPRQPGLVPAAWGELILEPQHRRLEAVQGLEGFSHLWLITQFHLVPEEAVRHSVRPPRLGGNERLGVFATRSPFRPNRLGLSLVKLEQVRLSGAQAPSLLLSGIDCVSGTPVYDIKPYLPYCESIPEAQAGFAPSAPAAVAIHWDCNPCQLSPQERELIQQSLGQLPLPAYLSPSARQHHARLGAWEVHFNHAEDGVHITQLQPLP